MSFDIVRSSVDEKYPSWSS